MWCLWPVKEVTTWINKWIGWNLPHTIVTTRIMRCLYIFSGETAIKLHLPLLLGAGGGSNRKDLSAVGLSSKNPGRLVRWRQGSPIERNLHARKKHMVLGSRNKLSNKILRKNYIEYTLGSEKENKLPMPKLCVCAYQLLSMLKTKTIFL